MAKFYFEPIAEDDGLPPSNLTTVSPWSGMTGTVVAGTPNELAISGDTAGSSVNRLLAFTEFDAAPVGSVDDAEVWSLINPSGSANSSKIALRCDLGTDNFSANGYILGLNRALDTIDIVKIVGGTDTVVASVADSGSYRIIQCLAKITTVGTDALLQVKVWNDGDAEPAGWSVEYTDTSPLPAGAIGYSQDYLTNSFNVGIRKYGLGTNGDAAPTEPVTPGGVTASGTIAPASISPVTGSASGSASISGSPAPMSITPAAGSATGSASGAGAPAALYIVATTGSAVGSASAIGSPTASTLSAPTGSATGEASVSGQPASLSIVPPTGSASAQGDGSAVASGSIAPAGISPPSGSAVGAASASGAPPSLSLVPATGSSAGGAVASGSPVSLSLVPPTGAALGSARASGSITGVGLTPATGSAHEGTIQVLYKQRIRATPPDGKITASLPDGKVRATLPDGKINAKLG